MQRSRALALLLLALLTTVLPLAPAGAAGPAALPPPPANHYCMTATAAEIDDSPGWWRANIYWDGPEVDIGTFVAYVDNTPSEIEVYAGDFDLLAQPYAAYATWLDWSLYGGLGYPPIYPGFLFYSQAYKATPQHSLMVCAPEPAPTPTPTFLPMTATPTPTATAVGATSTSTPAPTMYLATLTPGPTATPTGDEATLTDLYNQQVQQTQFFATFAIVLLGLVIIALFQRR